LKLQEAGTSIMSDNDNKESICRGIARLLGSEANTRHLRSLPVFRVDHELPADFQLLLRKIDGSEQSPNAGRN
jgi:hypothetical protein